MDASTPISVVDRAILHFPPNHNAPGTLPVALASILDNFDRIDRCKGLLDGFNLSRNPWQHPPEAIVAGGMQAVRGYFEAIFRGGTTVVTRPLKVVIIGKETVGKTRYDGTTFLVPIFSGSCTISGVRNFLAYLFVR